MAAKNITYGVEGLPHQRTSPRVYTHALIGHRDVEADVKRDVAYATKYAKINFPFYVSQVGEPRDYLSEEAHAEQQARYAAIRDMGEEAFVASEAKRAEARVRENTTGAECVIQWSMSERAAVNSMGAWKNRGWLGLRVVPCFPVQKRRGAPVSTGSIYK